MDRREALLAAARPFMRQVFYGSCKDTQEWYEQEYENIYRQVKRVFLQVAQKTKIKQEARIKNKMKYIYISSLKRGRRTEDWEFRIEALDETLFLDEIDTGAYINAGLFFPYAAKDLDKLYGILKEQFPRMQSYEKDALAEEYLSLYEAAAYKLFKELTECLYRLQAFEGIERQQKLLFLFGEYMGKSQILFESAADSGMRTVKSKVVEAADVQRESSIKYYLLKTDEGNRIPVINNYNDVINIDNLTKERIHRLKTWNIMDMSTPNEVVYPDVIHFPFFAVSKECIELISLYEQGTGYRCVKLFDSGKDNDKTYILPVLEGVDCLSEESQYNLDKSIIKKIVIDDAKIGNHSVFQLSGFSRPYVIARLDFVESMRRRGAIGVRYEEVEKVKRLAQ